MVVFVFYVVSILVVLTVAAGIADLIGWLYPDWLAPEDPLAEADSKPRGLDNEERPGI